MITSARRNHNRRWRPTGSSLPVGLLSASQTASACMEIENLFRYTALAVGLMEIEHLIRYTALAVGLKPSASQGEARLRGL